MNVTLTALIVSQAKTFLVMMAAGILTETLWQVKKRAQTRLGRIAGGRKRSLWVSAEAVFWIAAAGILSGFLYYCAYGKLSLHAGAGYFIGLLLWKKILQCVILSP